MSTARSDADEAWGRIAGELATSPATWRQLLAVHTATVTGHCQACTTGGTGMRVTPWPCAPQRLAADARDIHHRRGRPR